MKILILSSIVFLFLGGCGKKIEVKDIIADNAPSEIITPCLVEKDTKKKIICPRYSLNRAEKIGDGDDVEIFYNSIDDIPRPFVALSVKDFLSIRRLVIFLIPKAYTVLKEWKVTPQQIENWLEKNLPGGKK